MKMRTGEQSTMVSRIDRRALAPVFKIGERVYSKTFGDHGEVIFRCGGRYKVRWDSGMVSSGGFGGFDLKREPKEIDVK